MALRIIVDREREIEKFVPVEYWTIEAELTKKAKKAPFRSLLIGLIDGAKLDIHNQQESTKIKGELERQATVFLK